MESGAGFALLTAMVASFEEQGIRTVFEGIEEGWQLELAEKSGASMVQGFVLARPELAPTSFRVFDKDRPAPIGSGRRRQGAPSGRVAFGAAGEGLRAQDDAMTGEPDRRRNVGDAIFADEVGIEYGVYGAFRLRSAYQPIFAPRGRFLQAVAVEGLIEPHRAGRPVAPRAFFDGVPAPDRLFVETMCRVLHLRNFRNIGVDGLDLFFNYNPLINDHLGRALAEIRLMTRHLDDLRPAPRHAGLRNHRTGGRRHGARQPGPRDAA